MSEKAAYLKCKVTPGMFSNEVVIEITDADGQELSFIVPKKKVRENSIQVEIVQEKGAIYATIPTPSPENPIPVRKNDLVEA